MKIEGNMSEQGRGSAHRIEQHDPAASVERAEERVRRAVQALSNPDKIIGPSGERGNIEELEKEMRSALQEVQHARDALSMYRNAHKETFH